MGTPVLWSTVVVDLSLWAALSDSSDKLQNILSTTLQRGGNFPLSVEVVSYSTGAALNTAGLDLITQHSHRWRNLMLDMDCSSFALLSAVKTHLPLLETLEIFATGRLDGDDALVEIFSDAPRLACVTFAGSAAALPTLSWDQLRSFTWTRLWADKGLEAALRLAEYISSLCEYSIDVDSRDADLPLELTPVSPYVGAFRLSLRVGTNKVHAKRVLGQIMSSLTLPYADEICFESNHPSPPLSWSHDEFMALILRSSSPTSITTLDLMNILITDDQLLECLAALPALEELSISDCVTGTENVVITDKFLRGLTLTPTTEGLVPGLQGLQMTSLLCFNDSVLVDFVTSHLVGGRTDSGPFECHIWSFAGHERQLSQEIHARLKELIARRELEFCLRAHDE
jgi:hypothetical protein